MEVVYEDNHLLVVDKPHGLLTQDSGRGEDNLEDQARQFLKAKYQKSGNVFLHAVHRLDRPVSGLVLFAKSSKALSRLQEASRRQAFTKIYRAWVEGAPKLEGGSLRHFLLKGEHETRVVAPGTPGAKEALLDYRLIECKGHRSLLEIELHTGRYHQIRAQLSAMGCPIVGDQRYGAGSSSARIQLHHHCLRLLHPVGGRPMEFLSSP